MPQKTRTEAPAPDATSMRPSTGTLSELMYYECKSFQRDEFPQQAIRLHSPIVTVRELFAYVRGFNTHGPRLKLFLELSKEDFANSDSLEEEILNADFTEGTVFFIEKGQAKGMSKIQEVGSAIKPTQGNFAVLSLESSDPAHIGAHNNKKEKVIVEVVNNPEDWHRLINLGVHGIVTDDPHRLLERLRSSITADKKSTVHHTPIF